MNHPLYHKFSHEIMASDSTPSPCASGPFFQPQSEFGRSSVLAPCFVFPVVFHCSAFSVKLVLLVVVMAIALQLSHALTHTHTLIHPRIWFVSDRIAFWLDMHHALFLVLCDRIHCFRQDSHCLFCRLNSSLFAQTRICEISSTKFHFVQKCTCFRLVALRCIFGF